MTHQYKKILKIYETSMLNENSKAINFIKKSGFVSLPELVAILNGRGTTDDPKKEALDYIKKHGSDLHKVIGMQFIKKLKTMI